MSRISILQSWSNRGLGALLGSAIALNAWAGDTTITVGEASVTVTGPGSTVMGFPVTRTGDLSYDAYLNYQTTDGTALAGIEYLSQAGGFKIPAGVGNITLPITVFGKVQNAPEKNFTLNVFGATSAPAANELGAQQPISIGSAPVGAAISDVNGDSKPDVVVLDGDRIWVLTNSTAVGASSFSFSTPQSFVFGGNGNSIVINDLNGDGKPDVAIGGGDPDPTVWVLINTTPAGSNSASFAATVSLPAGSGNMHSLAMADFNGDEVLDLVVDNYVSGGVVGTLSVLLNTTTMGSTSASFSAPQSMTAEKTPLAVATTDINGDGKPDVIVTNNDSNNVSVLLNNTPFLSAGPQSITGTIDYAIPPTDASISPSTIDFGNVNLGDASAPAFAILTNTGTLPLLINDLSLDGPYLQANDCGGVVPVGGSCQFTLTFVPTSLGVQGGTVTLTDNAADSPQTIVLSGTGMGSTADMSTTSLTFSAQAVGSTSTAQTVTLTNNGNVTLGISSIAASGDFAQNNDCGTSLAAGTNCTISVTFTPTVLGNRSGSLTITDDATGNPHTINLEGTGLQAVASLSPTSTSYTNRVVGSVSPAHTITLTNAGNTDLTGIVVTLSGTNPGQFDITNHCPSSLPAQGQCTVDVMFSPTDDGLKHANLKFTDSATDSPQLVALTGTATQADPNFIYTGSPNPIDFGIIGVNNYSSGKTVTLKNVGTASLTNINVSLSGGQFGAFIETPSSCSSLSPGDQCVITVVFHPATSGVKTTNLHFSYKIDVTGTGYGHNIELDGTAVTSGGGGGSGCPPPPFQCQ